ncbi:MAG: GIY-YIG nuclease family protein [Nitrospira sp.]|nr:GIY-YIG nuclease family protein [Nitrospira sp.]
MDRAFIIHEIQRTAKENNGKPLGQNRFTSETGIKYTDWFGVYWARWSDAAREAGLTPNTLQAAYDRAFLFYKIGRSNATGRRTYELDLQLPDKTKTVHVIRTDDPAGIEAYWHTRFASKSKE